MAKDIPIFVTITQALFTKKQEFTTAQKKEAYFLVNRYLSMHTDILPLISETQKYLYVFQEQYIDLLQGLLPTLVRPPKIKWIKSKTERFTIKGLTQKNQEVFIERFKRKYKLTTNEVPEIFELLTRCGTSLKYLCNELGVEYGTKKHK